MILKSPDTRVYTVNLFADYLVSKIHPNEESIFSIADCKNFFIIKGKTTQKEILIKPRILILIQILSQQSKKVCNKFTLIQITGTTKVSS